MYAIKKEAEKQVTPNLLPCSIKHNGPIQVDRRYWMPETNTKNDQVVYFRGRRLEGSVVKVPDGYEGVILQKTDERLVQRPDAVQLAAEEQQISSIETKLFTQEAVFHEMIIWDHEAVPDAEDTYMKGLQEWIAFAEEVSYPV